MKSEIKKRYVKEITESASIPVLISIMLVLWFYIFQQGLNIGYDTIFISEPPFLSNIQSGLIRSISHLNRGHLIGNISSFIAFSILICVFEKKSYYLIQVLLSVALSCIFVGFVYTNTVGFSVISYSMYGVCTVICLFKAYDSLKSIENRYLGLCLSISLLSTIVIGSLGLIIDSMLLFDIVSKENLEFLYPVVQLPDSYSDVSSLAHIIGFKFGFLLSSLITKLDSNSLDAYRDTV